MRGVDGGGFTQHEFAAASLAQSTTRENGSTVFQCVVCVRPRARTRFVQQQRSFAARLAGSVGRPSQRRRSCVRANVDAPSLLLVEIGPLARREASIKVVERKRTRHRAPASCKSRLLSARRTPSVHCLSRTTIPGRRLNRACSLLARGRERVALRRGRSSHRACCSQQNKATQRNARHAQGTTKHRL